VAIQFQVGSTPIVFPGSVSSHNVSLFLTEHHISCMIERCTEGRNAWRVQKIGNQAGGSTCCFVKLRIGAGVT